jgi:hypothetical protein
LSNAYAAKTWLSYVMPKFEKSAFLCKNCK